MRQTRSSNTARLAYGFVMFSFVGAVTVLAFVAGVFAYRAASGHLHYDVEAAIGASHLGRLPRHVTAIGDLPVIFDARNIPAGLVVLTAVRFVLFALVGLVAVWMLRNLIKSARDGDPFVMENVRRLRVIGFVLVLYPPLSSMSHMILESMYITRTPGWTHLLEPRAFEVNVVLVLASLSVLVLAQVFARGVELRADVEGTI